MKIDIKQKIRLNLPETNSSSSHSLVIGFDNHLKSKEDVLRELESHIDDSGILRISSAEFGWDNGKFNTTYEKLQYLMAISCSYYGCNDDEESFSDKVKVQKLLGIIERIVKRKRVKKTANSQFSILSPQFPSSPSATASPTPPLRWATGGWPLPTSRQAATPSPST